MTASIVKDKYSTCKELRAQCFQFYILAVKFREIRVKSFQSYVLDGWSPFTVLFPWRSHVSLSSLRATGKKEKNATWLVSFWTALLMVKRCTQVRSVVPPAEHYRRALPPSTALIHFCCTLCQIQSNPFLHRISRSSLSELEVANLAPLTLIITYEKYC